MFLINKSMKMYETSSCIIFHSKYPNITLKPPQKWNLSYGKNLSYAPKHNYDLVTLRPQTSNAYKSTNEHKIERKILQIF